MTRRATIQTPLGEQLQLRKLSGREAISELFALDVELLSTSRSIDPKALLGQNATVTIETAGGGVRHLDGIVTRFGMAGQDHRHYAYRARLSPWLWLATRRSDFRIFQFKTVPEILAEVLGRYGYPLEQRLTRSYRAWDYCVQYDESDYQFCARLMEHEGIYWFCQHSAGQHVLVLADDVLASHSPVPGAAVVPFHPPDKLAGADEECIYAWRQAQEIASARHYTDDYDFRKPRTDLAQMRQDPPGHAHDAHESYGWPGGYTEYGDGETTARVRLQSQLSAHSRMQGTANHRSLACGHVFTFRNYPREDQNQAYLLVALNYHFEENAQVSAVVSAAGAPGTTQAAGLAAADGARTESGSIQRIELTAHPTAIPYRPQRLTPKPRTRGPQTAVVVGPPGEEIWCDQYGRVKVQFHWDRIGARNEHSSCWVRVATSWAGPGFGAVFTPRIGMEVIIDFLSGDPDHPILMGCVYNADNLPPWGLPGNQTQSGIKTKSSKGGAFGDGLKNGAGDANAIRFEDKAGQEQLWLHAQKDQLTEVEHDEDKWVGNDRRKTIDRDETTQVKRDRTETVDRNEKITVHGWRTEEVDGNETISIHSNRTETVDLDEKVTVHKNQSFNVDINRSKTVGRNEKDKIGNNWSIKVGKTKTETIGIAYMQNVGVGRMENVGVAYNLNVGAMMATVVGVNQSTMVGSNQSTTVGSKYSLNVGGGGGGGGAPGGGAPMAKNIQAPSGSGGGGGGGGSSITMDADSITLQVGKSLVVLKKDGSITLNGQQIDVVGGKHIGLDSKRIDLN